VLFVSLKMDKIEYRAGMKFFVKEGLTPNEIHYKFLFSLLGRELFTAPPYTYAGDTVLHSLFLF